MYDRRRALWSAAAMGLVLSFSVSAHAESLLDAVSLAYQTNPTLQQQRASQRAIDEEYVQARSGLRPQISATLSGSYSDGSSGVKQSSSVFGTTGGDFTSMGSTIGLTVSQPLLTGGRVVTAVDAAQADILQGRENLRTVEAQVLQSVIQSYVDVRRDLEALAINQENVKVLQRQLEETSARFDVGELTRTDVAQAQARLAAAQSSLSASEAQLSVSRAAYAAVVGQAPADLAVEPQLPGVPAGFDEAMDIAQQDNAGLRAAQYAQQATRARVAQARADYRPELSVSTTYGSILTPSGGLSLANRDEVRASATVSVPLFTGGLTGSRVRAALERDNAALSAVDSQRRVVLQSVSQAWARVIATRASLTSDVEQVKAATIAAEGVRQEAQVGLRTTLDVLNAEQELRQAQLALVGSRHDNYVAISQLLAAMGRLEARELVNATPVYDPKRNFDRIKHKGALPLWDPLMEALDQLGKPSGDHATVTSDAPIDQQLKAKSHGKPLPRKP